MMQQNDRQLQPQDSNSSSESNFKEEKAQQELCSKIGCKNDRDRLNALKTIHYTKEQELYELIKTLQVSAADKHKEIEALKIYQRDANFSKEQYDYMRENANMFARHELEAELERREKYLNLQCMRYLKKAEHELKRKAEHELRKKTMELNQREMALGYKEMAAPQLTKQIKENKRAMENKDETIEVYQLVSGFLFLVVCVLICCCIYNSQKSVAKNI